MKFRYFLFLLFLFNALCGNAQVKPARIFSDNMVLQRSVPIPIWGTASKGSKIEVLLSNKKVETVVDSNSKWRIDLPAFSASGPYNLSITELVAGNVTSEKTFQNVMIGDVWLASGQSNMELKLRESKDGAEEIAKSKNSNIRFFIQKHCIATEPQSDLEIGTWKICDSTTIGEFSAVACYFSKTIQQEQNVAIGIIQATWGGSPVEAWTSEEALMTNTEMRNKVETYKALHIDQNSFNKDSLDEKYFFDIIYNSLNGEKLHVIEKDFNDSSWQTIVMPKTFRERDSSIKQDILWLRKNVELPENFVGEDLRINLGYPDMLYNLYFNGQLICKNKWNAEKHHSYIIPSKLVRVGLNVITLRLAVMWGGGGLNEPADSLYLSNGSMLISLCGNWKYCSKIETALPTIKYYHKYPSYLFNGMINPLIPYALKGFLWYQGEENAGYPKSYSTLFPLMINDWRKRWNLGDLPFIYVQLPNFMKRKAVPSESDWALLREAQTKTLSVKNTAMVTTIDLGEWDNIHPRNKKDVGLRMYLATNRIAYSKPVISSGPMFDSLVVSGSSMRIYFKNVGTGLKIKGNTELKGFAIAGSDGIYFWVKARIEGNIVVLESEKVLKPLTVRYAWADNPDCNLYNLEGLPAVPFRTDNR